MKKTTLLLVMLVSTFTFSLTGCGGNKGGAVTENSDQSAIDEYNAMQAKAEKEMLEELGE